MAMQWLHECAPAAAKCIAMAAWLLHGTWFGEEAAARKRTKPCVFPYELAAAGDEGYLVRSFAAESRESYWSGRIKVAIVISQ